MEREGQETRQSVATITPEDDASRGKGCRARRTGRSKHVSGPSDPSGESTA